MSPRSGPGQSRGDPPVTPFGLATIVASVAFVVAGIALPEVAESLLRLMIATFAFGFVLSRVYRAGLPERTTTDEYSPFRGPAGARESATAPRVLRDLASKLAAADEPRSAKRSEIPRTVRWTVVDEATRRLAEHRRLSVADSADHASIRSLVSDSTWRLIRPSDAVAGAGDRARAVTMSELDLVLDDLERL